MDAPPDRDATEDALRPAVRVLQIIHGALMAGVAGFLAFATLSSRQRPPGGDDELFGKIAFFAAAVGAVVASVLPQVLAAGALKKAGPLLAARAGSPGAPARSDLLLQTLLAAYQSSHIVGMALLEGAAMVAVIAVLRGSPPWFPLGLLLLMAWRFPTFARVADWIDARRAEIDAGLHR